MYKPGLWLTIALCTLVSGCVLSKTTVEERTPELKYRTSGTVAIAVVDNRPFVTSAEKPESCEGIFRDGYGIPHKFEKLRDDSEKTFVSRIAEMLSKSLYDSGGKVTTVFPKKGSSIAEVVAGMRSVDFDRGLIVNVRDSRIDAGGFRWSYFFDYDVIVIDSKGETISSKSYSGEDVDFQREIFNAGRNKGKSFAFDAVLDVEYKNKFSEYLADRETQAALAGAQPGAASQPSAKDRASADRLAALKGLLDKGLITREEYEKKKAEILQEL